MTFKIKPRSLEHFFFASALPKQSQFNARIAFAIVQLCEASR